MKCNTLEFSVGSQTPKTDVDQLVETLCRRGAFFSHMYSIYRYGQAATGYRMNIPTEFPWEPFYHTLKDSGLARSIDDKVVELNVIPIHHRG